MHIDDIHNWCGYNNGHLPLSKLCTHNEYQTTKWAHPPTVLCCMAIKTGQGRSSTLHHIMLTVHILLTFDPKLQKRSNYIRGQGFGDDV